MAKNARESGEKRPRPHAVAGEQLKRARGDRTFASIADAMDISIGRLQNWETGYNRPSPPLMAKLSTVLGIDVGALYGVHSAPSTTGKAVSAKVVLELVAAIERNLTTLKIMCSDTPTKKRLHAVGIRAKTARNKDTVS